MIKLGLIGCGGMGGHHARTIHGMEGVTFVHVADTSAAKATKLATEFDRPQRQRGRHDRRSRRNHPQATRYG